MCRAESDPCGGRRCPERNHWHVNREGHERFEPDVDQERHWMNAEPLQSMTPNAVRVRRCRARKYCAEVDALRTVNGVDTSEPIGPVLREELWSHRYAGAGLSILLLAERFQAVADEEDIDVATVAERYADQHVVPHRQRAGERPASLVMTVPDRPDWVDPDRLVCMVEPLDNGTLNPAYLRVVKDPDHAR